MTKPKKRRSRLIAFAMWTGIAVAVGTVGVIALQQFAGMHLQISGGLMPQIDFHHEERHYRAIEAHRERSAAPGEAVNVSPARRTGDSDPDTAASATAAAAREPSTGGPSATTADAPDSSRPPDVAADAAGGAESLELADSAAEGEPTDMADAATAADHAAATAAAHAPAPGSWPFYRGVKMDGRYPLPVNTSWPDAGPPELWRIPVGGGYASFVVGDGLAFTIEQRREQEVVAAYDLLTGVERWNASWDARFEESMGGDGPRATPAFFAGTLVALGATGELRAFDTQSGVEHWRANILEDSGAANLVWGMAASPAIAGGAVLTAPGGPDGAVIAYELDTGAVRWKALDSVGSYTAPAIFNLDDLEQIVVIGADRVVGLTTDGSRTLWTHPWTTQNGINAAQPLQVAANRLFVSSGYGQGAAVIEIEADTEAGTAAATEIWFNNRMKNTFSTSVLHDGHVYGLDNGILACVAAATGERTWKGGRYGHGQLLLASGHLLITTERGNLVLVRATPESHQEVAALPAVSGRTWNNPAIAEGILLVRNDREAVAYDLRPST